MPLLDNSCMAHSEVATQNYRGVPIRQLPKGHGGIQLKVWPKYYPPLQTILIIKVHNTIISLTLASSFLNTVRKQCIIKSN